MGRKNNLREKFCSNFSVAGCNKKRGGSEREIQFSGWRGVKIKKVVPVCGSCVWTVERRMRNKWVSHIFCIVLEYYY